jgi:hypothetical protein
MNSQILTLPTAAAIGASVFMTREVDCAILNTNIFPLFGADYSNSINVAGFQTQLIDFAALEKVNIESGADNSEQVKLEKFFNERAARWEKESKIHSSPGSKFLNRDYVAIISKGEAVVPHILKRLQTSNCDWLWALENIVPENENPARGIENFKDAKQAWLEWGNRQHFPR